MRFLFGFFVVCIHRFLMMLGVFRSRACEAGDRVLETFLRRTRTHYFPHCCHVCCPRRVEYADFSLLSRRLYPDLGFGLAFVVVEVFYLSRTCILLRITCPRVTTFM